MRSWWRRQTAAADAERAAALTRVIPALEPIIEAERARGNTTTDLWNETVFGGPSGSQLDRHLRFPLDAEAFAAEFVFDRKVWLGTTG